MEEKEVFRIIKDESGYCKELVIVKNNDKYIIRIISISDWIVEDALMIELDKKDIEDMVRKIKNSL